jgi:mycothiol system anti-sigma-R factor
MKWIEELRRLLRKVEEEGPTGSMAEDGMEGGVSCHEAAEALYEWLDGELDPKRAAGVGEHLETCARCYPFLVFERSFREALARAAEEGSAPEGLQDRILESLKAEGFETGR